MPETSSLVDDLNSDDNETFYSRLKDQGEDTNVRDQGGFPLLMIAILSDNEEAARSLIGHPGTDLLLTDRVDGHNAFDSAIHRKNPDLLATLLENHPGDNISLFIQGLLEKHTVVWSNNPNNPDAQACKLVLDEALLSTTIQSNPHSRPRKTL